MYSIVLIGVIYLPSRLFSNHCFQVGTVGGGRVLARDQSASLEDWQKLDRTGEIVWFYNGRDRKKTGKTVRNGH